MNSHSHFELCYRYYQPECWTHVCHTEELPAVFDPNATSIDVYPTEAEVLQSDQIQYFWSNFAESGDPSKGRHAQALNVDWTAFGGSEATLMINDVGKTGIVMDDAPDASICDFWDGLGYPWLEGTK